MLYIKDVWIDSPAEDSCGLHRVVHQVEEHCWHQIRVKVVPQNKPLILTHNSYFNANKRLSSSRWTKLYNCWVDCRSCYLRNYISTVDERIQFECCPAPRSAIWSAVSGCLTTLPSPSSRKRPASSPSGTGKDQTIQIKFWEIIFSSGGLLLPPVPMKHIHTAGGCCHHLAPSKRASLE